MRNEPYPVRALRILAAGRRLPVNGDVMRHLSALSPKIVEMAKQELKTPDQRAAEMKAFHDKYFPTDRLITGLDRIQVLPDGPEHCG